MFLGLSLYKSKIIFSFKKEKKREDSVFSVLRRASKQAQVWGTNPWGAVGCLRGCTDPSRTPGRAAKPNPFPPPCLSFPQEGEGHGAAPTAVGILKTRPIVAKLLSAPRFMARPRGRARDHGCKPPEDGTLGLQMEPGSPRMGPASEPINSPGRAVRLPDLGTRSREAV